jgi:hypothetical protein
MAENVIEQINRDFKDILFDLDSPPGPARKAMEGLNEGLVQARCLAKGKVLPTSLKPCFATRAQVSRVEQVVQVLMGALEKMVRLYFENPEYRDLFELDDVERELVEIDPGFPERSIVFARADSFLRGEDLWFIEFNCDSPGGAYYTDIQTGLLAETEPLALLAEKYALSHEPLVPRVLETLLEKYRAWGGARRNPTIAVVGDGSVTNVSEFVLFGEYFAEEGHNGFFTEPWDLSYDGNVLSHQGRPINIVYRRGVIDDVSRNVKRTLPLARAMRDGNVCVVNPLRAKLGDNKNLLHLLTDERIAVLLEEEEREVIRRHIPWTRMLRDGSTEYQGLTVDLREFVAGNREKFVIKPNSEYGGRGVVIGRESDTRTWYETLEKSRTRNMVVQEYVSIPEEEFPVFGPELEFQAKKINHNFFVFDGSYAGGFARISDSSIINVSAGGGLVPLLVVEED